MAVAATSSTSDVYVASSPELAEEALNELESTLERQTEALT